MVGQAELQEGEGTQGGGRVQTCQTPYSSRFTCIVCALFAHCLRDFLRENFEVYIQKLSKNKCEPKRKCTCMFCAFTLFLVHIFFGLCLFVGCIHHLQ